jgi:hypothetical protein
MKIIIITDHFEGNSTPNAHRVRGLVQCFGAKKGVDIYVFQSQATTPPHAPLPRCTVVNMPMRSGFCSKIGSMLWKYRIFYRIFSWVYFILTKNNLHQNFLWHFKKNAADLVLEPSDVVICTAPSFGTLWVGDYLQQKFNCKYYADYRDLFTTQQHRVRSTHPSRRLYDACNRHFLEKKMVQNATAITTATDTMRHELMQIFGQKTIHTITNGYDQELDDFDFEKTQNHTLTLVYFGTLVYTQDIDNQFFEGLEIFVTQQPTAKISVIFVGTDQAALNQRLVKFPVLAPYIVCTKWLPLHQGLELVAKAHILVQFSIKNSAGIAGTKTYTYIKARKAILFVQPDGGEIQRIFDDLQITTGVHTACEVAQVLYAYYQRFCANEPLAPVVDAQKLEKYSRHFQSQRYWDLLQNTAIVTYSPQ